MGITTVFRRLLDVTKMLVEEVQLALGGGLRVAVPPAWRRSRCGQCGRKAPRYVCRPTRSWRHLPWGGNRIELSYKPWRVSCSCCGIHTEVVPRAASGSRFAWSYRSRLQPLGEAARTIRKHLTGILVCIQTRLTNDLVAGINGKLRMIARRAYGFHSHQALIEMISLSRGGIQVEPPLPTQS